MNRSFTLGVALVVTCGFLAPTQGCSRGGEADLLATLERGLETALAQHGVRLTSVRPLGEGVFAGDGIDAAACSYELDAEVQGSYVSFRLRRIQAPAATPLAEVVATDPFLGMPAAADRAIAGSFVLRE